MKRFLLLLSAVLFVFSMQLQAQDYVGSAACKACHNNETWDYIYDNWEATGHPYKFNVIVNDEAPTYPVEAVNFQSTWLDSLANGSVTWANVAGVIGGYGWKARFVGTDGHIIGTLNSNVTPGEGHNQFNFYGGEKHGWVDYHPSDEKIYNYACFKCHTTGGTQDGTWLAGVDGLGTFTEQGIGCESCHGPGGDHASGPTKENIKLVNNFAHLDNASGGLTTYDVVQQASNTTNDVTFLCGTCHNRGYANSIDASGGFIKHHEQWDEFVSTPHGKSGFMTCITCHDPHKRVIWDGDGITKKCEECHTGHSAHIAHTGEATCVDCHMPYAAKSGTARGESGYVGDVRSHILKISVDGESMFNAEGTFVADDGTGASLSLHYSCLGCHNNDPNDDIPDKTIEQAIASAAGMHDGVSVSMEEVVSLNVYPNPAFGDVNITFALAQNENVTINIFNTTGQLINTISNNNYDAGSHNLTWSGTSNTGMNVQTGIYFVNIQAGSKSTTKKLVFVR